jgi:hypothetical protein
MRDFSGDGGTCCRRTRRKLFPHREREEIFTSLQVTSQTFASRSGKYQCTVKVFNSSVEIFVEKLLAEIQMTRDCKGLLLIAQF